MKFTFPFIVAFVQTSLSHCRMETEIAETLHRTKRLICKHKHPVFIYHQPGLGSPSETILNSFLAINDEPLTVLTNQLNPFRWKFDERPCLLLFADSPIDEWFLPVYNAAGPRRTTRRGFFEREIRMFVVTPMASFERLLAQFIERGMQRAVYFVFTETQHAYFFYNQYSKEFQAYLDLRWDPWMAANRNLAGSRFKVKLADEMELTFTRFVLGRINGTLVEHTQQFRIIYEHFGAFPFLHYSYFYIHRMTTIGALVPRLNAPKPLISVLLDPFDVETWAMLAVMTLAMALLKMCYSQLFSVKQFLVSALDVLETAFLGSCMKFYRQEKQIFVGTFLMLNVVLMAAYESMVISFLLNPRFYPELDTREQLLKSCCWVRAYASFSIVDSNDCRFNRSSATDFPLRDNRGMFLCYILNPRHTQLWDKYLRNVTAAKDYRWSNARTLQSPVVAMVENGVGLDEVFRFYAGLFFAEAELYKFYERARGDSGPVFDVRHKPLLVEDLGLLWICVAIGAAVAFVVFLCEMLMHSFSIFTRLSMYF